LAIDIFAITKYQNFHFNQVRNQPVNTFNVEDDHSLELQMGIGNIREEKIEKELKNVKKQQSSWN
jgi:predicted oxidoreductase (fatty acid repression mutant protein)